LAKALSALQVPHEVHYYRGEIHAFHALIFREAARRCWRDTLGFTAKQLGAGRTKL